MSGPIQQLADWLGSHPRVVDAGWAALLFPPVLFSCLTTTTYTGPDSEFVALAWAAAYVAPLVLRRTNPSLAALGILPAHLAQLVFHDGPQLGNVVVPIVLFAVAAYDTERRARVWLVAGLVAALAAALSWTAAVLLYRGYRPGIDDVMAFGMIWVGLSAIVAASWFMGSLLRARHARAEAVRQRAEALERERDQRGRLAAAEERQRIAREMHDIVAHSLSVIVVQADGGAYAADSDGEVEQRLRVAAQALENIRTTARSALEETRRLVGVLRADDPPAERTPSAGLADVPALVEHLRAAGRRAEFAAQGHPAAHAPLAAGAELAAYRIVQESLTNVVKHAGPEAAVWVRLIHAPDGLVVVVRDSGRGAATLDTGGHGLVGMRERVAAYGGSVTARNVDGGFEVVARLPARA